MKNNIKGFTLVELLIVIALIAILSVAVLATINPIEQSNKARDAKFKNDAAEVLGALERFYASQNEYPWNQVGTSIPSAQAAVFGGTDPEFGVVGVGGSAGVLITTSELKSSFMGKESFASDAKPEDMMYVYHNGSDSNYVCFHPKAVANRQGSKLSDLKCIDPGAGTLVDQDVTCVVPPTWTYVVGAANANVVCVPEGLVQ